MRFKKWLMVAVLFGFSFGSCGCVGTIVVATVIAKKRAAARAKAEAEGTAIPAPAERPKTRSELNEEMDKAAE